MAHVAHRRLAITALGLCLAVGGIVPGGLVSSQEKVPEIPKRLEEERLQFELQKKLELQRELDRQRDRLERGEKSAKSPANPPAKLALPARPIPAPAAREITPREKTYFAPAPAIQPIQASPEQIATWIAELDADVFDTRETAMLNLWASGSAVLPSLRTMLKKGSLEATTRALFVIRQLGLAADLDAQDDAGQLLVELSEQTEALALARRAAATLADLTAQRSAQAVAALEELGAKISRMQLDVNNPLDERVDVIEIGEKFQGAESDLRRLKWIIEVRTLLFNGQQVNDDWIKRAAVMPGLEELHIFRAKISDDALQVLADHPSLRTLGIYNTPIQDTAIKPLAKLPLLSFVKLYGTRVSREVSDKFEADSGLTVDFRKGAFLGVGGQPIEGRCLITTVHRGSPADVAGIQPNDTIVRFGGAEVTSFNKLTELIAPREFGDEVEVEILRPVIDAQTPYVTMTKKVTLGGWEADTAMQNARPNR